MIYESFWWCQDSILKLRVHHFNPTLVPAIFLPVEEHRHFVTSSITKSGAGFICIVIGKVGVLCYSDPD